MFPEKGEVEQEEMEEDEEDKSTWKLVIIDPEVGPPTTVTINDALTINILAKCPLINHNIITISSPG